MAQVPECIVCMQGYDERIHVPRLLACGHSFCEVCLKQLQTSSAASSGAAIRCPECSHRTPIPAGGQSLPKNIELLRLLPSLIREPTTDEPTKPATRDAALVGLVEIDFQQWLMGETPSISEHLSFSTRSSFHRSTFGDELPQGSILPHGETLVSNSEEYTFTNEQNGNLCLYNEGYSSWESGTSSMGRGDFMLLTDGNLVLFDTEGTGKPIWASMSQGIAKAPGPYRLIMQDDGNLVIYGENDVPTWASWSDSSSGHFTMVAGQPEMPSTVTWLPTCDKLVASNGKYSFVNQGDGNLCVYNEAGAAIWSSGTRNKGAGNLYMERDGNLVLYNTDGDVANPGAPIWASGTARRGAGPFKLVMQDDGNLVIYDSNSNATWASRTGAVWRSFIKSELRAGGTLHAGDSLISTGEEYTFINQDDGNLVTYTKQGRPTWASGTGPGRLTRGDFQLLRDGNLILVDTERGSKPVWASMSQGLSRAAGPYRLIMQDDGNLVIYGANSVATWATRTLDGTSGSFTSVAGRAEMPSGVTWLEASEKLVSRNLVYTFENQQDGDLVIYSSERRIWSSRTSNRAAGKLYMQRDGNLVLYNNINGDPTWSSATSGRGTGPYKVIMQNDGNLVIYDAHHVPIWTSSTVQVQGSTNDTLLSGDVLRVTEKLVSRNAVYKFVNQGDGNLVIYKQNVGAIWASGTNNQGFGNLYMQRNGYLVLYHADTDVGNPRSPIWSSGGRKGTGPSYKLVMQNDGNLAIYDTNHKPTWASNTNY